MSHIKGLTYFIYVTLPYYSIMLISNSHRMLVYAWHKEGMGYKKIQRKLNEHNANYSLSGIKKLVGKIRRTDNILNLKRAGRPRSVRNQRNVAKIHREMTKNLEISSPKRTPTALAKVMRISRSSVRRIIKFDLALKPFKKVVAQHLTENHIRQRMLRCTSLLDRFSTDEDVDSIIFTDETPFTLQSGLNRQNSRIYAQSKQDINPKELLFERKQFNLKLMVWIGISVAGKLPIIFFDEKINAENYIANILRPSIRSVIQMFSGGNWVWQQDGAAAHTALITQNFFKDNGFNFITKTEWPPNSCDLSPLDYCINSVLKERVYAHKFSTMAEMKKVIIREWRQFPQSIINDCIHQWRLRLEKCVEVNGRHFEHFMK